MRDVQTTLNILYILSELLTVGEKRLLQNYPSDQVILMPHCYHL